MRRCSHCLRALPRSVRADVKYCSAACRNSAWRRRIRTSHALKRRCKVCRQRIALPRRTDAQYCSPRCRQRGYRARQASRPRKARQRVMRERLAAVDAQPAAVDIGSAVVRAITLSEAKAIVELYEPMPAVSGFAFGIFLEGRCGGAVVYGDDYGENLGVWDCYGYSGRIIALLRGACLPWAHPHAASKLIRRSMDLLPQRYNVVTATVDRTAGEIGTIYQACGFDFVGTMRKGGRALIGVNGKHISERQAGRLAGTRGAHALAKLGFDVSAVPRKERYFAFRGHKRERARLRQAIAHLLKPYPKRFEPIQFRCQSGANSPSVHALSH